MAVMRRRHQGTVPMRLAIRPRRRKNKAACATRTARSWRTHSFTDCTLSRVGVALPILGSNIAPKNLINWDEVRLDFGTLIKNPKWARRRRVSSRSLSRASWNSAKIRGTSRYTNTMKPLDLRCSATTLTTRVNTRGDAKRPKGSTLN